MDDLLRHHEICQFLYREARLQDEHRFEEWERLWTDDAIYWVPANGDGGDPEREMSIIYDNRSRIGLRIRQYLTGKRYSQLPRSRLRRVVGNIEVLAEEPAGTRVAANMILYESHRRGQIMWAARVDYVLRRVEGEYRLASKKVALVNNDTALTTMAFLI
ncbi:MAG TPA: aromatic-ring-hydroxylating dioxygenase subunit beta [Ramlibacter sp.]|uniref:aromatic-ring-hydroxylating dioxygenase subunit beta n=1 Tax=Ramlibacter sp. TaxID=1917967 RepID=UPI002C84FC92|nr:aromatic-ring-hydroxylating dioxygenase subunit beta [Ramlibacter sp.]HVZ44230.1 aromatic-ring-hydroxylating dioxygenase subunit beta [Ramlibacter sp.]